jgi:hypothetical protein
MKKTLSILFAVIFSACAAPPTNREATTSTNANANKPVETAAAPLAEADAIAKEKELWQTLSKQNLDTFGATLTENQLYVSNDGVHDKPSTIKSVTGFVPTDVSFADWKFLSVDKDLAVVTYTATVKGTMNGQPLPEGSARASTVWVNQGGKWLAAFHQDTEIPKTPPPPPAAKATPKAATSPTPPVTPPATTSNVEANEQAVWAALKAKQFDVFESFLAADSIEVESNGVFDRAGSVKDVQGFDFSKSALSDWKTVKLTNNASIVTYTTHFPGQKPDTGFHSTLWADRNGKWSAVFHQGTPKAPPQPAASPAKAKASPQK